jgi:hypothetical protein
VTNPAKFLVVAALIGGCNDSSNRIAPPLDRFHYPIGIAVRHALAGCAPGPACSSCQGGTAGCRTLLYVASTNFDVAYDPDIGGTVMAVDPDQAVHLQPLQSVGETVLIGSFAGQLSVVDEATCPGWEDGTRAPLALVTSRSLDALYAMPLGSDGAPSCGDGCQVPLEAGLGDPFGVAVSCRGRAGAAPEVSAWVSYLSTQLSTGVVSQVDLHFPFDSQPLQPLTPFTFGEAVVNQAVYDPVRDRLYLTSRFFSPSFVPVRYMDLGFPTNIPAPIRVDLAVAGAETTGIAISSDGTRAYVALRLYDPDLALVVRPGDIGGALAVLDLADVPQGGLSGRLLGFAPLGLGPSEVRAIPRAGMRDLVAVTCTLDSSLYLYDDEIGAVAKVIGADPATGAPLLGRRAHGLAVESPFFKSAAAPSAVRLFVASFDQSFVSAVELDDPTRPAGADVVRIVDPGNPSCTAALCPVDPSTGTCAGASCPGSCPAGCLVPKRIGPERQ